MFERPKSGEQALLLNVFLAEDALAFDRAADEQEFESLALSAGAEIVARLPARRDKPDARWFIGKGKVDELADLVRASGAQLLLVNQALSPSQERNLEKALSCRVLDRTGLILDIFAQRARSHEGKLQVELAQLRHLSTRLVRGWTHLERQKGGIGLRGPGETQLETDRRLLGGRIAQLNRRLQKVQNQREQGRHSRRKAQVPTVSLVGYTNAGKSSLFNALTESGVYAADQLFATLDPTLRRLPLDDGLVVVLADTVGFIKRLPHELVAAFQSTLQETVEADLLLHVVDASDPERDRHQAEVDAVLDRIGARDVPRLLVFNKIDQSGHPARVAEDEAGQATRLWLSAKEGIGLDRLKTALQKRFGGRLLDLQLCLEPHQGRARSRLFELGTVLSESFDEQGRHCLSVRIASDKLARWRSDTGLSATV